MLGLDQHRPAQNKSAVHYLQPASCLTLLLEGKLAPVSSINGLQHRGCCMPAFYFLSLSVPTPCSLDERGCPRFAESTSGRPATRLIALHAPTSVLHLPERSHECSRRIGVLATYIADMEAVIGESATAPDRPDRLPLQRCLHPGQPVLLPRKHLALLAAALQGTQILK